MSTIAFKVKEDSLFRQTKINEFVKLICDKTKESSKNSNDNVDKEYTLEDIEFSVKAFDEVEIEFYYWLNENKDNLIKWFTDLASKRIHIAHYKIPAYGFLNEIKDYRFCSNEYVIGILFKKYFNDNIKATYHHSDYIISFEF